MENKRYKPLIGKTFWIIWVPTLTLLLCATALSAVSLGAILIMAATDAFVLYFLFSSIFAYAELREHTLYIKFGFIIKREIPYNKIRAIIKERRFYSESMLSIKNSAEHVTVKYNKFDTACVSVVNNDEFIAELRARMENQE